MTLPNIQPAKKTKLSDRKLYVEKKTNELGHELGKWKYGSFNSIKQHHVRCTLCNDYAVIDHDGHIWGTAIQKWRPVRVENGIGQALNNCYGPKLRGKHRRAWKVKQRRINKAYEKGGIEEAIKAAIGEYPNK